MMALPALMLAVQLAIGLIALGTVTPMELLRVDPLGGTGRAQERRDHKAAPRAELWVAYRI